MPSSRSSSPSRRSSVRGAPNFAEARLCAMVVISTAWSLLNPLDPTFLFLVSTFGAPSQLMQMTREDIVHQMPPMADIVATALDLVAIGIAELLAFLYFARDAKGKLTRPRVSPCTGCGMEFSSTP